MNACALASPKCTRTKLRWHAQGALRVHKDAMECTIARIMRYTRMQWILGSRRVHCSLVLEGGGLVDDLLVH